MNRIEKVISKLLEISFVSASIAMILFIILKLVLALPIPLFIFVVFFVSPAAMITVTFLYAEFKKD